MSSLNPLVSVVIASYNHAAYINDTINSVLTQTYQNFEIVITDDGSTDNSLNVIKNFTDPRIKIFEFKKNQGACTAINHSIINSSGYYIAVMNSDDVWDSKKLEIQVSYLQNNKNIDAVFSNAEFLDENLNAIPLNERPYFFEVFNQKNKPMSKWLESFFFEGNCLCHPSILIKKSCYDKLGLYNNRYRQLPDFDMWIRFCKYFELYILPEKLVKFRLLNDNKNASSPTPINRIRGRNEHHLIMKSFFKNVDIELFKEAFADHLKFKDVQSDIEMKIEQAFLFTKTYHSIIGLEMLYCFLEKKSYKSMLLDKYHFDDKGFQSLAASCNSFEIYSNIKLIKILFSNLKNYSKIKLIKILVIKFMAYIKNILKV
jgi:glycosyltransferase involved in cell wall biosynthesis